VVISNRNSFWTLFDKIASVYFIWKIYLYFSIGNGQPGEPALCQLYRHTFVHYSTLLQPSLLEYSCKWLPSLTDDYAGVIPLDVADVTVVTVTRLNRCSRHVAPFTCARNTQKKTTLSISLDDEIGFLKSREITLWARTPAKAERSPTLL